MTKLPFTLVLLGAAAVMPALPGWADPASPNSAPQPASAQAAPSATDHAGGGSVTVDAKAAENNDRQNRHAAAMADRKAFMDARLAGLHAGLQLSAQQEPLWSPLEDALRELVKARGGMRRTMWRSLREGDGDPTARLKDRGDGLIAVGQAIGKLADAARPLLAALTPDQKGRLPVLLHGVGPHRIVAQAFAVEDRRPGDEDAPRRGFGGRDMREGPMFGGERRRAFGGYDDDGPDRGGWNRRADRDRVDFDRAERPSRFHHRRDDDDERG